MSNIVLSKPVTAEVLRAIFGKWQGIRGIPRLLWWLRRLAFPAVPVLVKSPDNLPFVLNREDYGQVMLYYFPYCLELQALISDVVRPGDICLDLGANVGLLAAHMANCAGENGRVIAVEPNPPVFAQLSGMIKHSCLKQIVAVPAGIAEKDGVGGLYLPEGGYSASAEVKLKTESNYALELLSITSVARRYLQERTPDFIKIDIEGNEAYLIESLHGLLEQGLHPILLVEFHPQKCEQRGWDVVQIIRQLVDLGYQMKMVKNFKGGYRLLNVSQERIGHENILFFTAAHLSQNPNLALKWSE